LCVAPVITIFYNEFSNSHLEYCSILVLFTIKMKSSRSKRRRIIQSYVSPPRPDLPATFESLSDDPLTTILEFVGNKSYRSFGGLNKQCREIYVNTSGMAKETFLFGYAPLSVIIKNIEGVERTDWELYMRVGKGIVSYGRQDVLDWALEERNKYVLEGICKVAVVEERFDILEEVLNKVEDDRDKRYVFLGVDHLAADHGKLNVLKWFETKGLFNIEEDLCAEAAAGSGHIQILQWLQEEQDFELIEELYLHAICGGHLNVVKWLREQACSWDEQTFIHAALEGNLEIIQWLHDEGCPFPEDDCRVYEDEVKPEVLDWLRVNGYSNRIQGE